jgi:carbonic anhydrase
VSETPILRRAWQRGEDIRIHGLIYGMRDGLLRNLDCTIARAHTLAEAAQ